MTRPRNNPPAYFLDTASPALHDRLLAMSDLRLVFFAGLPGAGKSLLLHQLAHLAAPSRTVSTLQWDVARPPFEASTAGRPYPQVDGVTHPVIRRAVGLWARAAIGAWHRDHDPASILIGEVPLVGNRLIELTQSTPDIAEVLLTALDCRFVLPVPSLDVRRHIESERDRRSRTPLNPRELEDAPPHLLRDAWLEVADLALHLGLAPSAPADYDPGLYEAVYTHLLRDRHLEVLPIDLVLPTSSLSVYDIAVPHQDLAPSPAEAASFIHAAERLGPLGDRLIPELRTEN